MTIQNAVSEADGIDVTRLVGSGSDPVSEAMFDAFKEAHTKASEQPCVTTFRACVTAFDLWQAQFTAEAGK